MCKPSPCNRQKEKKSQCSEVRPWRNATLFLCSQKWCRVNECRHSESLQSDNPALADGHSPRHAWSPGCALYGWVCGCFQRRACIEPSGCVGTVPAPLGGERLLLPAAGSSGTAEAGVRNRSLAPAPASFAPGHCSLSCHLLRPENSLPSFILLP